MKFFKTILLFFFFAFIFPYESLSQKKPYLLNILKKELDYNYKILQKEEIKPYYIVYRAEDTDSKYYQFKDGQMQGQGEYKRRQYDVGVRVGSPEMDNSHFIRGTKTARKKLSRHSGTVPTGNNDRGIRQSIFLSTDAAYKQAVETYKAIIENIKTKAEEEDKAPDFLLQKPEKIYMTSEKPAVDMSALSKTIKECSRLFINNPDIINNTITLQHSYQIKYFADTEGTEYTYPIDFFIIHIYIQGRAKNGMEVFRRRSLFFKKAEDIYDSTKLIKICKLFIRELGDLINAEAGDPYTGPAIFSGKAAAVFFHEIFGHRVEGHRHRDETFGQTFTKKMGEKIAPDFITIIDDPGKKKFNQTFLNGYYPIDDEGVLSQPAVIIDKGILKTFLLSRKGVLDFRRSNGHGRGNIGREPVSRMGNTFVKSEKKESMDELRKELIRICKEKDLPFGYFFKEVKGGFTSISRRGPQTFKVIPVMVYKIYVDTGKPDSLVNGVDIVGTPLASIASIISTSSNYQVFNGSCGAESGYIPVSAVAPDILFKEIEIEKKQRSFETEPILLPVKKDIKNKGLVNGMQDEIKRNMKGLKLEDNPAPFFIALKKVNSHNFSVQSEYGTTVSRINYNGAALYADVKLGDYETTSDYFSSRTIRRAGSSAVTTIPDDYYSARNHFWRLMDSIYKSQVEKFAVKKDYLKNHPDTKQYPDFSRETRTSHIEKEAHYSFNPGAWESIISKISGMSLEYKDINNVTFSLRSVKNHSTYINSENSRVITFPYIRSLIIDFKGQRDDLTKIKMKYKIRIPWKKDPSFLKEKIPEIKDAHSLFQNILHCKVMEDYSGPIILEGSAASDLIIKGQLIELIKGGEPVLSADSGKERSSFVKYRNRKLFPSFISVIDDPLAKTYDNQRLIGHYEVDHQGVAAQRVEIIKKGKLLNALYCRRPGEFKQKSTGHGRGRTGMGEIFPKISNLFIESKETVSKGQLKKMLMEKCKENELAYGIIIRQVSGYSRGRSAYPPGYGMGGGRKILEAYKIDAATGEETLVSGGEFENFNIKSLKDIAAVSKEKIIQEYFSSYSSDNSQTVIIPDFLIEDVDIRYTPGKKPKKPAGLAPLKR